jgi:hypothetical protein
LHGAPVEDEEGESAASTSSASIEEEDAVKKS